MEQVVIADTATAARSRAQRSWSGNPIDHLSEKAIREVARGGSGIDGFIEGVDNPMNSVNEAARVKAHTSSFLI